MDSSLKQSSQRLLIANQRLQTLQSVAKQQRKTASTVESLSVQPLVEARTLLSNLPPHLGWRNANTTYALHKSTSASALTHPVKLHLPSNALTKRIHDDLPAATKKSETIRVFHDVALGILRHDLAASGRVWLLLRHIDTNGRGWIEMRTARQLLTGKDSTLRICGWRQLRNLTRQGQDVFWKRDSTRIWLHSVAKVAAALDVPQLTGRPVAVPVVELLKGIGNVRAYLYATFHSQRSSTTPISRLTLEKISSVPTRTQRIYEQKSGVQSCANFAVGPVWTTQANREQSWQSGSATFQLIDHYGEHGQPGRKYVAWRLPNSYKGSLSLTSQGRKKHLNHTLKDLVNKRVQGNSGMECARVFFTNSVELAKFGRKPKGASSNLFDKVHFDQFWPAQARSDLNSAFNRMWYVNR